jgi:hypothetical protein
MRVSLAHWHCAQQLALKGLLVVFTQTIPVTQYHTRLAALAVMI